MQELNIKLLSKIYILSTKGGYMREIKFRAWDTEREVMATVNHISLNDYEVSMEDENCVCWRAPYPYVCRLMQYTGMKDKNRKEIYQGDLVKTTYIRDKSTMVCEISKIEYEYTLINIATGEIFKFDEIYRQSLEVIGNIFENPKLLR